jgi:predicted transcriptional regulator
MRRGHSQGPDRLLQVLIGLSRGKKRVWCYPSQDKLVSLLARYHGIRISRRTLNRWLRDLESAGFIRRIRRHRMGEDGRPRFFSTVYVTLRKALRYAASWAACLGVRLWGTRQSRGGAAGGEWGGEFLPREVVADKLRQLRLALGGGFR